MLSNSLQKIFLVFFLASLSFYVFFLLSNQSITFLPILYEAGTAPSVTVSTAPEPLYSTSFATATVNFNFYFPSSPAGYVKISVPNFYSVDPANINLSGITNEHCTLAGAGSADSFIVCAAKESAGPFNVIFSAVTPNVGLSNIARTDSWIIVFSDTLSGSGSDLQTVVSVTVLAPKVLLSSPVDGQTVSGSVNIIANNFEGIPNFVKFSLKTKDAAGTIIPIGIVNSSSSNGEWIFLWDTTRTTNGEYFLLAEACDSAGTCDNQPPAITVTVNNSIIPAASCSISNSEPISPIKIGSSIDWLISYSGFFSGAPTAAASVFDCGDGANGTLSCSGAQPGSGSCKLVCSSYNQQGQFVFSVHKLNNSVQSADCGSRTVNVFASQTNQQPIVEATMPASCIVNQACAINGTASDTDGTISSLQWENIPSNCSLQQNPVGLQTQNATNNTTIICNIVLDTVFSLTATDNNGAVATSAAKLVVVANLPNKAPTAIIATPAANQTILSGQSIFFEGNGTDEDGTITEYYWSCSSNSGGCPTIFPSGQQNLGLVLFSQPGIFSIGLKVKDNNGAWNSNTETRIITVNTEQTRENIQPVAVIDLPSEDQSIVVGKSVNFFGHGTDTDGTITAYSWNCIAGTGSCPTNFPSNAQNPGAIIFTGIGAFTITFDARDNSGAWAKTKPARTIIVSELQSNNQNPGSQSTDLFSKKQNHVPVIKNIQVNPVEQNEGEPVVFIVSAQDEDNDKLDYFFDFNDSFTGKLSSLSQSNIAQITHSFFLDDLAPGETEKSFTVKISVSDGTDSVSETRNIAIKKSYFTIRFLKPPSDPNNPLEKGKEIEIIFSIKDSYGKQLSGLIPLLKIDDKEIPVLEKGDGLYSGKFFVPANFSDYAVLFAKAKAFVAKQDRETSTGTTLYFKKNPSLDLMLIVYVIVALFFAFSFAFFARKTWIERAQKLESLRTEKENLEGMTKRLKFEFFKRHINEQEYKQHLLETQQKLSTVEKKLHEANWEILTGFLKPHTAQQKALPEKQPTKDFTEKEKEEIDRITRNLSDKKQNFSKEEIKTALSQEKYASPVIEEVLKRLFEN